MTEPDYILFDLGWASNGMRYVPYAGTPPERVPVRWEDGAEEEYTDSGEVLAVPGGFARVFRPTTSAVQQGGISV